MMHKFLLIILLSFCLFSCNTDKQKTKQEQIQHVINKSGFIKFPLVFDANDENALKINYSVNYTSDDTLLFEGGIGIYEIIGFLPDTTNYYAFLHLAVGDMLYPTIVTMDKNWQKIDEKIICTTGCLTSPLVDVTSCYDSVWIYEDLTIKSVSKFIGTMEDEEEDTVIPICNTKNLEGFIDKNGKITIKESGLINCSE